MCEPVGRLNRVLVNHEVDMGSAIVVETRVDGNQFHNAVCVGVPTTAEPGGSTGEAGVGGAIPAIHAGRICW